MTDKQEWWRVDFDKNYCPVFSDMIPAIEHLLAEQRQRIIEVLEEMRKEPTKHEGCHRDQMWCYTHGEIMDEAEEPNGAIAWNTAIAEAIAKIKEL